MLGGKSLRIAGVVALILFSWFTLTADLAWAGQQDEGDALLKARRLYQQGDYEGSIRLLDNFIAKLKAIVAQKKNVADAFYLLAKVYYTVGEDQKVDDNLRKVFETYPAFEHRDVDVDFAQRAERIRLEVKAQRAEAPVEETVATEPEPAPPAADNGIILTPAKKKKKKFPVLLVLGGVAVVALLAVLLGGGGSKDDKKEPVGTITRVRVRVTVVFAGQNLITNHKIFINDNQKLFKTVRFNDNYDPNADYESLQKQEVILNFEGGLGTYEIRQEVGPFWAKPHPLQDNYWIGKTVFKLDVVEYDYVDGRDPGAPVLSTSEMEFHVNPDDNDPASDWYRIESQNVSIMRPASSQSMGSSPQMRSGDDLRGKKN